MSHSIERLEKKLDDMFTMVNAVQDIEAKARLAEYLCIRTSGLLESVVKQLVSEFMDGNSQQEANRYVKTKMQTVTNLKHAKLEKLLDSFSSDWQNEYASGISDAEKASLNSIIDLRNSMAHGGTQSVSFVTVKSHYDNVKNVIAHLKAIIRKRGRRQARVSKSN